MKKRDASRMTPADWDASLSPAGDDDSLPEEAPEPAAEPESLLGDLSIEERVDLLPTKPGVYLFKDARGTVLYVGKAVSLRGRVRQYFHSAGDGRPFIDFLRRRIHDVDFIVTDTEKEALLLENVLIKKHNPRYNIRLRDDKLYVSLRLDPGHEWPRVHRVRRRRARDKALYFGPFDSSRGVKETLRFLQRIFPIRSCPDSVLYHRARPCVLHQIGRCCAPCTGQVSRDEYQLHVEGTVRFLTGRRDEVLAMLRAKMMELSDALEFEKAAMVRDRITAIERTIEGEKVQTHRLFDRDVVGLTRSHGIMLVTVLHFRAGKLEESRHFNFKDLGADDGDVLGGFLTQHYDGSRPVPRDILLSAAPADGSLLQSHLDDVRGGAVRVSVPVRGQKRRLVEMALENGARMIERHVAGERTRDSVLEDLKSSLGLPALPHRIECFDISNFQGSHPVAAMTVLVDGEPARQDYRHFKVRTLTGQDDFAAMREVVERRYRRLVDEAAALPDLVVIDGGKGQLNAACDALESLGLKGRLPVVGLAKARVVGSSMGTGVLQRTEERVFLPGVKNPVVLDRSNPALFLLMRVRDEAHRFGVTFHRKQRSSGALKTGLEGIAGLGGTRQILLLRHFGSLTRLRTATLEEISSLKGMPRAVAEAVYLALHRPSGENLPTQVDDASHGVPDKES